MSYRVIVADNQDLSRVGTARLLGVEDDFHIVGQCADPARLIKAVETFAPSAVFCAASLASNWSQLRETLRGLGARIVLALENTDKPEPFLEAGFEGILYRSVAPPELIACVRTVASGGRYHQPHPRGLRALTEPDALGRRARQRLTHKELQIVALLIQGYRNRDIAEELGNTEQVIKNYMRSIFDKTGVADRLELALFTIHHRVLLDGGVEAFPTPCAAPVSSAWSLPADLERELVSC